jgi:hypothetical protein
MGYDKNVLFKTAKKAVKENNLFFIEDIVAWLPCDKTTFYRMFPVEVGEDITEDEKKLVYVLNEGELCNGYNYLKEMLEGNKIKTKSSIRAKLYQGDKAAELLALYKLICSDEERRNLSMQHLDHTSKGKRVGAREKIVITTGNKKS